LIPKLHYAIHSSIAEISDMKALVTVIAVSWIASGPLAAAASVSVTWNGDAVSIYVDGEAQNGAFDTIFFQARPIPPASFTINNSGLLGGVPRPPGEPSTYPNRMLTADPLDFPGGLALTQVGLINTPQELSFTVGALGGTITTAAQPNGDLFLGNLNLPGFANASAGANATVQLISAGSLVQELNTVIFVPEPAAASLAILATTWFMAVTRRKPLRRRTNS
jgi:hypothetical protein